MANLTFEDLPEGAVRTIDDARKIAAGGGTIFIVLPWSCSEPRIERHKQDSLNSPHHIGIWGVFESPLHLPFGGAQGFVFSNYWYAYAHRLRTRQCK